MDVDIAAGTVESSPERRLPPTISGRKRKFPRRHIDFLPSGTTPLPYMPVHIRAPSPVVQPPTPSLTPSPPIGTLPRKQHDSTLRKLLNLCTYKLHALGDYVISILRYGTTDGYTTQPVIISSTIPFQNV